MDKPMVGHPYVYVKVSDGEVESTAFTLFADGSCGFHTDAPELGAGCFKEHTYEFNPDGWKKALAELDALGFIKLSSAKKQRIVPEDWQPEPGRRDVGGELIRNEITQVHCPHCEYGFTDAAVDWCLGWLDGRREALLEQEMVERDGPVRILCHTCGEPSWFDYFAGKASKSRPK